MERSLPEGFGVVSCRQQRGGVAPVQESLRSKGFLTLKESRVWHRAHPALFAQCINVEVSFTNRINPGFWQLQAGAPQHAEIRLIKAFNILNTNQRVIHCGVVPGCYFTVIKPVSRHRNAIQKSITPEIPSALITHREVTSSSIHGASSYKGLFFFFSGLN